mmetsp:Transcript_15812/g.43137  ORF Transcript_15812/g.43137 Transcript_15812/m.43137 type:complete len:522 (-) Transcript_15812:143-1708(-)
MNLSFSIEDFRARTSRRSAFKKDVDGGSERRLLLISQGTRGDIQPQVALASRLKSDGFRVMVLTNADHVSFVEQFGVEVAGVLWDMQQMFAEHANLKESMSSGSWSKFIAASLKIGEERIAGEMESVFKECCKFAPHLVIGTNYWGQMIATLLGIPVIAAYLQSLFPTRYRTSPLNEPCCHYMSLMLVNYSIYTALRHNCAHFRTRFQELLKGKVLWDTFESYMLDTMHPTAPCIVAYSPALFPIPCDWACTNTHFTGFWVMPKQQDSGDRGEFFGGASRIALCEFLAAGSAPVYMGWGSMIAVTPEHMTRLAVRTLKNLNMRGVILGGWAKLAPNMLEGESDEEELMAFVRDHVLFVPSADHEWLFPQCVVTVHHGGAGTTAAALRSGRPTIVTPCWVDQFDNATIVRRSGCGVALPQFHQVTVTTLVTAIRTCSDATMQARCKELSERLLAEDGIGSTVKIVDDFFRTSLSTGVWQAEHAERQRVHKVIKSRGFLGRVAFALRLCMRRNPFPPPKGTSG